MPHHGADNFYGKLCMPLLDACGTTRTRTSGVYSVDDLLLMIILHHSYKIQVRVRKAFIASQSLSVNLELISTAAYQVVSDLVIAVVEAVV